jgi:hypothetical protein
MIEAQRLAPGARFRSCGRTGTVLYVVPDMRVRVKFDGGTREVTIAGRTFTASLAREGDIAPTAEVEPIGND